jgi:hypothetical protein
MAWGRLNRAGITGTSGTVKRDFARIETELNRQLAKLKVRSNRGLLLAAIHIRRDMEATPPLIPVEYGNLRASCFIITNANASSSVRSLEIKNATFSNPIPMVQAKLQQQHPIAINETRNVLAKFPIGVAIGFSAFYAIPVHEMVQNYFTGTPVNWSRPGSGAKFFQAAVYRNLDNIVNIVRVNANIP